MKRQKEPLFQMSRREELPFARAVLIRAVAIVLSLLVCALVIFLLTGLDPVEVYATMIDGAVGTARRSWILIRDAMVLLCVSLALAPAFRMRFWNIGAEGQILVGGVATAACMILLGDVLPAPALMLVIIVTSVLAGAVWGLIPALFKARWNTNETLFTLMLNYVAIQIVSYCVVFWENPAGSNSVGVINPSTNAGWLPSLFGAQYGWNVVIVLVLTAVMYLYMSHSKQGYEIAVVGESENTARYAGISVSRVIIRTMAISGGIAGLAGFILVSGSGHTISTTIADGRGYTAIVVAWLARFNPVYMILISFFLTFMDRGAIQIATAYNLSEYASDMITGIILFFILGSEFFINYQLRLRKKEAE